MNTKNLAEPLKDCVVFIDRCSGQEVARAFEEAGIAVELHDDFYSQTTIDVDWLAPCGEKNRIVLSSNKAIKRTSSELQVLRKSGVGAFFFTSGDWNTEQKLSALRTALPRMAKIILREKRPFLARIYKNGKVELWMNYNGEDLIENKKRKAR